MAKNVEIKTNLDIHYLIPVAPISNPSASELRECKVVSSTNGMLRFQVVENEDEFEIHSFWDEYFQWLIHTGYVIPITE